MSNTQALKQAHSIALEIKLVPVFNALSAGNFKEAAARLVTVFKQAQNSDSPNVEDIILVGADYMARKKPDEGLNLLTRILGAPRQHHIPKLETFHSHLLLSDKTSTVAKIDAYIAGSGLIKKQDWKVSLDMASRLLDDIPASKKAVKLAKAIIMRAAEYQTVETLANKDADTSIYKRCMEGALDKLKFSMNHLPPEQAFEQLDRFFDRASPPALIEIRDATLERMQMTTTPRMSATDFARKLG